MLRSGGAGTGEEVTFSPRTGGAGGSPCRSNRCRFLQFTFEHGVQGADDGFLLPGHGPGRVDATFECGGGEWVDDAEDAVAASELEQPDAEWPGCGLACDSGRGSGAGIHAAQNPPARC